MMGISLWIVPNKEDSEHLKVLMSPMHPTDGLEPESYPRFEPHVTLVGVAEDRIDEAKAIISQTPAPHIHLDTIQVGDVYFRSVYLAVRLTDDLLALHKRLGGTLKN
ncbi:hypothetical protein FA15DRAFT_663359 [Coprinopsis marcescibilis]|uniref:LigT-like protein n=1 Tax=Coprinopsis marcescibilis TaxID=230819 RepID=A0A5C3LAF7_COPMA|nr:hypothetical protein FA15DRAFT_663359 [Coprinopsis marcescibilis]